MPSQKVRVRGPNLHEETPSRATSHKLVYPAGTAPPMAALAGALSLSQEKELRHEVYTRTSVS